MVIDPLTENLVITTREICGCEGKVKPTKAKVRKLVKRVLKREYGGVTPDVVEPGYRYQELACMVFELLFPADETDET